MALAHHFFVIQMESTGSSQIGFSRFSLLVTEAYLSQAQREVYTYQIEACQAPIHKKIWSMKMWCYWLFNPLAHTDSTYNSQTIAAEL